MPKLTQIFRVYFQRDKLDEPDWFENVGEFEYESTREDDAYGRTVRVKQAATQPVDFGWVKKPKIVMVAADKDNQCSLKLYQSTDGHMSDTGFRIMPSMTFPIASECHEFFLVNEDKSKDTMVRLFVVPE